MADSKKIRKNPEDEDLEKKPGEETGSAEDKAAEVPDGAKDNPPEREETKDSSDAEKEPEELSADAVIDEALKDEGLKAAFDAKVQEAVEAAINQNVEQTGGEELPKDPHGEPAEPEITDREKELEQREKEIAIREKKAAAVEELTGQQLPAVLADCFNYESDESFEQSKELVTKAFQEALKQAVNDRVRGTNIPKTVQAGSEVGSGNAKNNNFAQIINEQRRKRR